MSIVLLMSKSLISNWAYGKTFSQATLHKQNKSLNTKYNTQTVPNINGNENYLTFIHKTRLCILAPCTYNVISNAHPKLLPNLSRKCFYTLYVGLLNIIQKSRRIMIHAIMPTYACLITSKNLSEKITITLEFNVQFVSSICWCIPSKANISCFELKVFCKDTQTNLFDIIFQSKQKQHRDAKQWLKVSQRQLTLSTSK